MEKLKLDKVVRENGFEINFYRYFEKNKEVSDYLREKQIIKKEEDTDDFLWFFKEFKKRLDLPIEVYDDYYISSMIDYVVSFFMIELYLLWFSAERVLKYKNMLLQDNYKDKLLEYYIIQTILKKEVNIYILGSSVEIMNIQEFIMNKKLETFIMAYVSVSLNETVWSVFGNKEHFVGETYFPWLSKDIEEYVFAMMEDDKFKYTVDEILNDKEYLSIALDKKWEKLDLIRKTKSYSLEDKLVDIKKLFPHSRVIVDNFGWRTNKILIEEKIKLDELVEKKNQLKTERKKLLSK